MASVIRPVSDAPRERRVGDLDARDLAGGVDAPRLPEAASGTGDEPLALVINGTSGADDLVGTDQDDTISGLGGADRLRGLGGSDILNGDDGDDVLEGGDGDDLLVGGLGNDVLDGGDGLDTIDFSTSTTGVIVNLATGSATSSFGTDTLTNIEIIRGTARHSGSEPDDYITGSGRDEIIFGRGGHDVLRGGGGNDQITGGAARELGAPDLVKASTTANSTLGAALSVDEYFDRVENVDVPGSNSRASATVKAVSHGGVEYYAVTVQSATTLTLDVDAANFNSVLRLFGPDGTLLAVNNDGGGDGFNASDSYLTFAVSLPGIYYIEVSEWVSGSGLTTVTAPPSSGLSYTLHVVEPNAPVVASRIVGASIFGDDGDDILRGGTGEDAIYGGAGNDDIRGHVGSDSASADLIDGGEGFDYIVSYNDAANILRGGAGDDTIVTRPVRGQIVEGGDGNDTLRTVFEGGYTVDLTLGQFSVPGTLSALTGIENAFTNSGNDRLIGSDVANVLSAGGDEDLLEGRGGDDTIDGGTGEDVAVFSSVRLDYRVERLPDGRVMVTDLRPGSPDGQDRLTGIETLRFSDLDYSVASMGLTLGGSGAISGTAADDTLFGDGTNNTLSGLAGDDYLSGGSGDDNLDGGTDDDMLSGGAGSDTIVGGDGSDTADYSTSVDRIAVNLSTGSALGGDAHGDALSGIENLVGTNSLVTDFLTGDSGANRLTGLAGDDELIGLAGDDTLIGGAGADALYGDVGDDNLQGGADADRLHGDRGADLLDGGDGDDSLVGGSGGDTLLGGAGVDTADYSGSVDRISVNLSTGIGLGADAHDDVLSGVENLIGTNSTIRDFLTGDGNANRLSGLAGDDELRGLGGNDVVTGGAGDDSIDGGVGFDTAVFSGNRSAYTITVSSGVVTVAGPDGVDTLVNVERLQFADRVTDATGEPLATSFLGDALVPLTSLLFGDVTKAGTSLDLSGLGHEILPTRCFMEPNQFGLSSAEDCPRWDDSGGGNCLSISPDPWA